MSSFGRLVLLLLLLVEDSMTTFRPLRLFGGLSSKKEVSLKLPLTKVYWEKRNFDNKKDPRPRCYPGSEVYLQLLALQL
jgi:hypothetical protein